MFGRIRLRSHLTWAFLCWEVLITDSTSSLVNNLLRFCIMHIPRNLSISSMLVFFWHILSFIVVCYESLYFCSVSCNPIDSLSIPYVNLWEQILLCLFLCSQSQNPKPYQKYFLKAPKNKDQAGFFFFPPRTISLSQHSAVTIWN